MSLEEIKDLEAMSHGWSTYNEALDVANAGVMSGFSFADIWEDIAKQYAKEQVKELEGKLRKVLNSVRENEKDLLEMLDSIEKLDI